MHKYLFLILSLILIGAGGCTRLDAAPAPTGPPPQEITTEQLLDYVVISNDGSVIGPVDGVVIGTETAETKYVIVFLEDIYNFGKGAVHAPQDHFLPIPWSDLTLDAATKQLVVDANATFVGDAPVLTEPPDTSLADWDRAVVLYWTK